MSERTDFEHPEYLTDTAWLGEHLGEPGICVVDCDVPDQYQRAHIPGAVFQTRPLSEGPGHQPVARFRPPTASSSLAESLGIGDDTLVVAYDNSRGLYAARLWWALHPLRPLQRQSHGRRMAQVAFRGPPRDRRSRRKPAVGNLHSP